MASAVIKVDVQVEKRWWLVPLLYLCVLFKIERPKEWLFAHGIRCRMRVGSKWSEWRSASDERYRKAWTAKRAHEIADELEAAQ